MCGIGIFYVAECNQFAVPGYVGIVGSQNLGGAHHYRQSLDRIVEPRRAEQYSTPVAPESIGKFGRFIVKMESIRNHRHVLTGQQPRFGGLILQPMTHGHEMYAPAGQIIEFMFPLPCRGGDVFDAFARPEQRAFSAGFPPARTLAGMMAYARHVPHIVHGPYHRLVEPQKAVYVVDT